MTVEAVTPPADGAGAADRTPQTVAEAYLVQLKRRGVDFLYVNGGTDFPPIVEAFARGPASHLTFPQPMIVAHENAAVGMAHGYTMVTGRPQAVMLHVSVGTANSRRSLPRRAMSSTPKRPAAMANASESGLNCPPRSSEPCTPSAWKSARRCSMLFAPEALPPCL